MGERLTITPNSITKNRPFYSCVLSYLAMMKAMLNVTCFDTDLSPFLI